MVCAPLSALMSFHNCCGSDVMPGTGPIESEAVGQRVSNQTRYKWLLSRYSTTWILLSMHAANIAHSPQSTPCI